MIFLIGDSRSIVLSTMNGDLYENSNHWITKSTIPLKRSIKKRSINMMFKLLLDIFNPNKYLNISIVHKKWF